MSRIFLYTESAELDARTRKAMVVAGYLPVKVAALDAVKFLEPAPEIPNAEVGEILRAAMEAMMNTPSYGAHRDAWERFVKSLGRRLIAAHDKRGSEA